MLALMLTIIDGFIPERSRRGKSDLGRARTFVFTHIAALVGGASMVAFLLTADPSPGVHVALIALTVAGLGALPFALRRSGNLPAAALASVQMLIIVTLLGVYNYGGVSSPFLPWLLIALANGFFYLNDRPLSVLMIFALNLVAFVAIWRASGGLPVRIPMERMTGAGLISVIGATVYMAGLSIYYGRLLTSESALELEARRHRQTAEQLALARDKAEKASRDRTAFLAKMSHELRTPLNAVIGYSEILQEDAEMSADPQRAKDLSRIHSAGKHLLSLLTEALDIKRIESSEMKLHVARFDAAAMINDVAATAKSLADANGNALIVKIDPRLGEMRSDETRLRQAALNLLSNAAKFTRNGDITLSARRFRVDATDWIEIEVRDSGPGIAADDLKTLFQDFQQVGSPLGGKSRGTGLGLAHSRKLCTMMGGDIFAESEPGHGACFTIRAPASLGAGAKPEAESDLAAPFGAAA